MVKINQSEQFKNYLLQPFIQVKKKKKNIFKLNINTFIEIQVKGHLAVVIFNKYKRSIFEHDSLPTVTPTLLDVN